MMKFGPVDEMYVRDKDNRSVLLHVQFTAVTWCGLASPSLNEGWLDDQLCSALIRYRLQSFFVAMLLEDA
jgi:hypothetical protein